MKQIANLQEVAINETVNRIEQIERKNGPTIRKCKEQLLNKWIKEQSESMNTHRRENTNRNNTRDQKRERFYHLMKHYIGKKLLKLRSCFDRDDTVVQQTPTHTPTHAPSSTHYNLKAWRSELTLNTDSDTIKNASYEVQ